MPEQESTPSPATASDPGITPPEPLVGNPPKEEPGAEPPKEEPPKEEPPKEEPPKEEPKPKAPEEYAEFTVPEGTTLDEQTATEFKGLAKELDLTQEQAQKLLDFGGGKLRAQIEAPYKLWAKTQAELAGRSKGGPGDRRDKIRAEHQGCRSSLCAGRIKPVREVRGRGKVPARGAQHDGGGKQSRDREVLCQDRRTAERTRATIRWTCKGQPGHPSCKDVSDDD